MRDINQVALGGRLGRPAKEFPIGNGTYSKLKFLLASNHNTKKDGVWQEETQWHPVEYLAKTGSINMLAQRLQAGVHVVVDGWVCTEQWKDKQTQEFRTKTYIRALNLYISPGNKAQKTGEYKYGDPEEVGDDEHYEPESRQPEGGYVPPPPKEASSQFIPVGDDDIPF